MIELDKNRKKKKVKSKKVFIDRYNNNIVSHHESVLGNRGDDIRLRNLFQKIIIDPKR